MIKNKPNTVSIDGKDYPINLFSNHVQTLLQLGVRWSKDLQSEQAKVKKTEVALDALNKELKKSITEEINRFESHLNVVGDSVTIDTGK